MSRIMENDRRVDVATELSPAVENPRRTAVRRGFSRWESVAGWRILRKVCPSARPCGRGMRGASPAKADRTVYALVFGTVVEPGHPPSPLSSASWMDAWARPESPARTGAEGHDRKVIAGIDVSKARLDVHVKGEGKAFANDRNGFKALHGWLRERKVTNVVTEATGRYHRAPHQSPVDRGFTVHVVNPLRSRRFAESVGHLAKSDRIDAAALAAFGEAVELPESRPRPESLQLLEELLVAREALIDDRTGPIPGSGSSPARR